MTTAQTSMFDALAARDAALERVDAAASSDWKDRAYEAVYQVALRKGLFTSEDLWALIEKPREPRALGPVLLRAMKDGLCEPTGRMPKCSMKSRHATRVTEYGSLIYRGATAEATQVAGLPAASVATACADRGGT